MSGPSAMATGECGTSYQNAPTLEKNGLYLETNHSRVAELSTASGCTGPGGVLIAYDRGGWSDRSGKPFLELKRKIANVKLQAWAFR